MGEPIGSQGKSKQAGVEAAAITTKAQLREYLAEIEKRVLSRDGADIAALVAINQILRSPNAPELIDDEIREQLKDLWIKIKVSGVTVEDPPLLFGLPANFGESGEEEVIEEPEIERPVSSPGTSKRPEPAKTPADSEDLPH